jgi:DNA-binding response OmpR family regulator
MPLEILVCDHQPHVTRALALQLSRADFDVHTASDGSTAWQQIERRRPDLVIAEEDLPGLDAAQLASRLRDVPELRDIPILWLSSQTDQEPAAGNIAAGSAPADVIPKPFSSRHVLERVRHALHAAHCLG